MIISSVSGVAASLCRFAGWVARTDEVTVGCVTAIIGSFDEVVYEGKGSSSSLSSSSSGESERLADGEGLTSGSRVPDVRARVITLCS